MLPQIAHGGGTCGGNAAPVFHNNTFFCVSQHTLELVSVSTLGDRWGHYSDINITLANGDTASYASQFQNVEDPYLWVDTRNNFHILNHRCVQMCCVRLQLCVQVCYIRL